ncbi:MAG: hypothetical protein R3327_02455 [Nitrosopumilaceae archaeon]|nr:hypothetical protein [Nitrosopumilaceae archaeon]
MKICSICHRISGSGQDHLDCIQKRRIELEDEERKEKLPEKLDIAKNPDDLNVEVKAILEHLTREKEKNSEL